MFHHCFLHKGLVPLVYASIKTFAQGEPALPLLLLVLDSLCHLLPQEILAPEIFS